MCTQRLNVENPFKSISESFYLIGLFSIKQQFVHACSQQVQHPYFSTTQPSSWLCGHSPVLQLRHIVGLRSPCLWHLETASADPQSLIGLSTMPTSNRTRLLDGGKVRVNCLLDESVYFSQNLAHLSLRKFLPVPPIDNPLSLLSLIHAIISCIYKH